MIDNIINIKRKYLHYTSKIVLILTSLAILAIISFIFLQVIMRYVFRAGFRWPHEISGFIFVWICFVGPIFPYEKNELIKIEFFRERLPYKASKIVEILISVIVLVALFLLIFHGFRAVNQVWSRATPALRFSYGYVYLSLPIGFSLLFIGYLLDLIVQILQLFTD